jgi:hypothetical protein
MQAKTEKTKMELQASDGKGFVKEKRPKIKKGYYIGVLQDFKAIVDKEGKDVEGKFGKQAVMLFEIYNEKGERVLYTKPDSTIAELTLAKVVYTNWKNKDGTYSSAITKGSQTTKTLKALGWDFEPNKALDTNELVGRKCEVNIDDYDAKWTDDKGVESTYKASSIKDVNAIEEEILDPVILKMRTDKFEADHKRLKDLLDAGHISKEGYDMAVEQLKH